MGDKETGDVAETISSKPPREHWQHATITQEKLLVNNDYRWLTLKHLRYKNDVGDEGQWECAMRTTRKGDIDAVFIVATVKRVGHEDAILLVSQFRPPCQAYVLEFPAGLVDDSDEGDNAEKAAEKAALRELREETGYFGEVKEVSPMLFVDPGMSNANLKFVSVIVDCDKELNKNPTPQQDEKEFISTHLVPKSKFLHYMRHPQEIEGMKERDIICSGLVYAFALSLSLFK